MRILIDLSKETAATARRLAQAAGISRKEWLEQVIVKATGSAEPEMVLGFWQVTNGEVDNAICVDCDQPIHGSSWIGMTTARRVVGPLCASCARTD